MFYHTDQLELMADMIDDYNEWMEEQYLGNMAYLAGQAVVIREREDIYPGGRGFANFLINRAVDKMPYLNIAQEEDLPVFGPEYSDFQDFDVPFGGICAGCYPGEKGQVLSYFIVVLFFFVSAFVLLAPIFGFQFSLIDQIGQALSGLM